MITIARIQEAALVSRLVKIRQLIPPSPFNLRTRGNSQEGYRAGEADRQDRWHSDYRDSYAYRDANYGYSGYYIAQDALQLLFREGFQRGYEDGFDSRYQYGRYYEGRYSVLDAILSQILCFQSLPLFYRPWKQGLMEGGLRRPDLDSFWLSEQFWSEWGAHPRYTNQHGNHWNPAVHTPGPEPIESVAGAWI